jgi:hypothetical protein
VRRHVKASAKAPIRAISSSRPTFGLACLAVLGLVAFLGISAPTASAIDTCPNVVFRTGPSAHLPECRAYELVTPRYTGGIPPTFEGWLSDLPGIFATDTVTPQGDSVVYHTLGGGLSGFSATGYVDRYRAKRTANGWVTEPISPGGDEMVQGGPGGVSGDHEYSVGGASTPTAKLWPAFVETEGFDYLRTPNGYEPLGRGSLGDATQANAYWISPHGEHVIFGSDAKLEPDAGVPNPSHGVHSVATLYDRTPGGPTHVVSLLPNDQPVQGRDANFASASKDGTEIAFTISNGQEGELSLYVRRNDAVTEEAIHAGGVAVGKELECSGPESGTFAYQWLRNGTPIGGATSSTYTTTTEDEGTVIQCRVTASDSEGTRISTSRTVTVEPDLEKSFPETVGYVTVDGGQGESAAVGTALTCSDLTEHGFADDEGIALAYRWLSDGTTIGGATSSTYTPVEADAGHALQCLITGSNANGTALAYSQASVSIYNAAPKASANPAISNITDPGNGPEAGDELSCSQGTWSGGPSFAYQWLRNGAEIGGATSSTYTVVAEDEEKAIQCRVTATNTVGSTQAVSDRVSFGSASTEIHPFLETFGSAAQPNFTNAEGLAVDQSNGDVLVIDAGAHTVSRWNPDGTPASFSALGTNVIDGQGSGDGTPQNGLFGSYTAEAREVEVAVDESGGSTDGNIYVTDSSHHLIDIFSSAGAYLGQLTASSEGSFGEACGVTVDPSGAVYVGDYNGKIHKFVPSANPPVTADNTANFSYPEACNLAAGAGPSAGSIFAESYGGALAKIDSSTGEVRYAIASGVTTVAVDPTSGHVYAVEGSELTEFDASGAASASTVSVTNLSGGQGIAIRGSNGNVYASRAGSSTISVYGPDAPIALEPPEQTSAGGVSGTARVGSSLFCSAGTWNGSPTITRQWLRNGAEIAGATSSSYTLTAEDLETVVQCRVAATNGGGSVVAIDANEGAKVVVHAVPPARAFLPSRGFTFDGIFNGHVFYSDVASNLGSKFWSDFGDLYMYDLDEKKTTRITSTGDASIVNVSEDGSHVYFLSYSPIGGEGEAGKPNLGVWTTADGNAKFIATVTEADAKDNGTTQKAGLNTWAMALRTVAFGPEDGPAMSHTRSTPDGTAFAFESTTQLSGFDNVEQSAGDCGEKETSGDRCDEVYRYDAESEELTCVSCGTGAGPATGNARLQSVGALAEDSPATPNSPVESLTSDGEMVFFESTEGLVPQDGNETRDVYRWRKGAGVALISTGQDLGESAIYGVTPDGSNVIFATRQQLLPEDENGSTLRLYDARVDGGFPPPEETVTEPCTGDICQGAASGEPGPPNVASSSLSGGGNVPPRIRCHKGARRVTRNGREHCLARHHRRHRRAHHKRRAAR